jgi:hypothetical protein
MCPLCLASAALIAGGAISTGGLTAIVIKKFCAKNVAHAIPIQTGTKEDRNG